MTRYAIDEQRRALTASWSTGDGDAAATIAELPAFIHTRQCYELARTLTELSQALWHTYTHPASAAEDNLEENSEGWRRQGERDTFTAVQASIANPHLPKRGRLKHSAVAVEKSAHRVGRALHTIATPQLSKAVAGEVDVEIMAVEQAELGNLSERARQAVALTRADPSPLQVAYAHRVLADDHFDPGALFTDVDPTAAAVAAANWLHAAATIAAEVSGHSLSGAIQAADDIAALPVITLSLVLDTMGLGASAREAVTRIIRDAMAAAEGDLPNPLRLAEELRQAIEDAHQVAPGNRRLLQGLLASVRTTPLDPARPAPQLLEDLLAGIDGCAALYTAHASRAGNAHAKTIRRRFYRAVQERAGALDQLM